MAKNKVSRSKKINVSIDEKLLQKIDDYADSHYMSRSAFFTYASSQILLTDQVYSTLDSLNSVIKEMHIRMSSDPNYVASEEDAKELEQFDMMLKMLSGEYNKNKREFNKKL